MRQHVALGLALFAAVTMPAMGQFKTDIINQQGAEAPCVGIGPIGGPAAKKCVDAFVIAGFIRTTELGWSGLTIGTSGADDGVVKKVDAGSPADRAGIVPGLEVIAVDGKPTHRSPAEIAEQMLFGKGGTTVHLVVRRSGGQQSIDVQRMPIGAPAQPAWPGGFMIGYRPMLNWHGQFAPCIGMGPGAPAAFEFCYKKFTPFGFVKVTELGTTGVVLEKNPKAAIAGELDPNSPAAKAGLKTGDEIVAIDGKALTASAGEAANELLFGKSADAKQITLRGSQGEKTVTITLVPHP